MALLDLRRRIAKWLAPRSLGERGEAIAARYLRRQGCKIVARGNRSRLGEIDLVAVDGSVVVFVEVKTRRSHAKGRPDEAVDLAKQGRITRQALRFLKAHGLLENPARFDVLSITWPNDSRRPNIEHFKNAFEAVGEGQLFS